MMTLGEVAKQYTDMVETIGEQFARQVNGLKGAATEGDVLRAMAAFPGLKNTRGVAANTWAQTIENVENAREGMHDSLFGRQHKYDPSAYSPEVQRKINSLVKSQGWDHYRAIKHLNRVGEAAAAQSQSQGRP